MIQYSQLKNVHTNSNTSMVQYSQLTEYKL